MASWLVELLRCDFVVSDMEPPVRRNHIDMVGFQLGRSVNLCDGHVGSARYDASQSAVALRREMDDDDIGSTALRRQRAEQRLKRLDTARRSADPHHGRSLPALLLLPFLLLPLLPCHEKTPSP